MGVTGRQGDALLLQLALTFVLLYHQVDCFLRIVEVKLVIVTLFTALLLLLFLVAVTIPVVIIPSSRRPVSILEKVWGTTVTLRCF